MLVPTGMLLIGKQLPFLIATLSPDIIFSPTLMFLGEIIYLCSPSSYFTKEINADLFGSYSFLITSAEISVLVRLKSINLYFLLTPPPILLDVILPWLFLPPVEFIFFVNVLWGFSLDNSFLDTKTVPLNPGVIGLNLINII